MDFSDSPTPVRSRWSCVDDRDPPSPEPISPELVLVDRELARRVRPVAVVGPPPPRSPTPEISVADARPHADRRSPRLRLAVTAVGMAASIALVTFATAAVPSADELPYFEATRADVPAPPRTVATTRGPTMDGTTPGQTTDGSASTTRTSPTTDDTPPPLDSAEARIVLHWRPVPSADYYNVILWSDNTRLGDYWPRRPRIAFAPRDLARLGAANQSAIHWFVYPITVEGGTRVAGPLHANGSITLPAAARG